MQNQAAHRAYFDALATAKIYHILAHDYEEKGLKAQGVRLINKEVDSILVDKK